jgi:hypothetical protein
MCKGKDNVPGGHNLNNFSSLHQKGQHHRTMALGVMSIVFFLEKENKSKVSRTLSSRNKSSTST